MLSQILDIAGVVWGYTWWIIIPLIAFLVYQDVKDWYKHHKKQVGGDWVLLQIVPPRDLEKTAKSMEQIFSAVGALEKGRLSFEIEGAAGRSYFYIRAPKDARNLVESAIYAQYPEAEILLVDPHNDYIRELPDELPNKAYDLYGEELKQGKDVPYPILTHPHFEEQKEEKRVDPISNIVEAMSNLKSDEHIWLQLVIAPTDEKKFAKKGEETVDALLGKKKDNKKKSPLPFTLEEIVRSPIQAPEGKAGEEKKEEKKADLTPGKREVLKQVEHKLSRSAFDVTYRFVFIDKRDAFSRNHIVALKGALRQFNTSDMNQLVPDKKTVPSVKKGLFKKARAHFRKRLIFDRYRTMYMRREPMVLNNEELATLYHFPITGVTAPALRRTSSRKGGPPPNLPISE